MTRVAFENKPSGISRSIKSTDYPVIKIDDENYTSRFTEKTFTSKNIKSVDYPNTKITDSNYGVKLTEILPFRVKFTTVGIEGYGPGNVPPIGIAIIGINNYIL